MNAPRVVLALMLVLAVSGCTDSGGGGDDNKNLFANDVIILEDLVATPGEAAPERIVTISGSVTNNGKQGAENVKVKLEDYCSGLFTIQQKTCVTGGSDDTCEYGTIKAGDSKKIGWKLKTPGADKIANLEFTCPLKIKASYSYTSSGSADVILAQENEKTSTPASVTSDGPVKIYIEVKGQPISPNVPYDVAVTIKDEGMGKVSGRSIPRENLDLKIPAELSKNPVSAFDTCGIKGLIVISEKAGEKKADTIYCPLTSPSFTDIAVTKHVTASLKYNYEFDNSANPLTVVVKPIRTS